MAKKDKTDEVNEVVDKGEVTQKQAQAAYGLIKYPHNTQKNTAKKVGVSENLVGDVKRQIEKYLENKAPLDQIAKKYSFGKYELTVEDIQNYIDATQPEPPLPNPPNKNNEGKDVTAPDAEKNQYPYYPDPAQALNAQGEEGLLRYVLQYTGGVNKPMIERITNYYEANKNAIKKDHTILHQLVTNMVGKDRADYVDREFRRLLIDFNKIDTESPSNMPGQTSIYSSDPMKPPWMSDREWWWYKEQQRMHKDEREEEHRTRRQERLDELREEAFLMQNKDNMSAFLPLLGIIMKKRDDGNITYEIEDDDGKVHRVSEKLMEKIWTGKEKNGNGHDDVIKVLAEALKGSHEPKADAMKPVLDVVGKIVENAMTPKSDQRVEIIQAHNKEMLDLVKNQNNPLEFFKNMKVLFPNAFGSPTESIDAVKLKMEQEWKMFENKVDLKKYLVDRDDKKLERENQQEQMKYYMAVLKEGVQSVLGPLAKYIGSGYLYEKSQGNMTSPDDTGTANRPKQRPQQQPINLTQLSDEQLELAAKDRDLQAVTLNQKVEDFNTASVLVDREIQRRRAAKQNSPVTTSSTATVDVPSEKIMNFRPAPNSDRLHIKPPPSDQVQEEKDELEP